MFLQRFGLITTRIGSTIGCQHVRHYDGRQAQMLGKLMYGKSKSRSRKFLPGNIGLSLSPGNMVTPKKKVPSEFISRRRTMLNQMFMRHISELVASDPISDDLIGYALEITDVQILRNYNGVNVYWSITGSSDFDFVQQKLQSIAGKLRTQLTRMQVMGIVPNIVFVRDKQASYMVELDTLLEEADYGEDYVPGQRKATIKDRFDTDTLDQGEDALLSMRHDILGLDHSQIMGRVKQHVAKAREERKRLETDSPHALGPAKAFTLTTSLHEIRSNALQRTRTREVLLDFLRRKRLQRKELRQHNQVQYLQPEEEEENAFRYEEEEGDAVDLNLCPDDDDEAYLNEYFYNCDIDAVYQFDTGLETDSKGI